MSVAAMSSERIEPDDNVWTRRLVLFLRIMAVLSVAKGLYHWAQVTGFIGGEEEAFENQTMAWQTATVYFAVIELVAAVGLWLATPWGAVVWLTTVVSMAVIELMFPGIYGGSLTVVGVEAVMLGGLSGAGLDGGARTAAIGHSDASSRKASRITRERGALRASERRQIAARVQNSASHLKFSKIFRGNFSVTLRAVGHTCYATFRIRTMLFPNATGHADEA